MAAVQDDRALTGRRGEESGDFYIPCRGQSEIQDPLGKRLQSDAPQQGGGSISIGKKTQKV